MTKDMTSGAITPLLIKFTIPLVLGNLFQLTYNAADSIIAVSYTHLTLPTVSSWASLWARTHWLPWAPPTP